MATNRQTKAAKARATRYHNCIMKCERANIRAKVKARR